MSKSATNGSDEEETKTEQTEEKDKNEETKTEAAPSASQ